MPEEIFQNIFRQEIPLPANPLKAINSYVIKGDGRFLMVDTGMNRPECMEAMKAYLEALSVDLKKTDFFITHLHADHIGLVSELADDRAKVYLHPADAAIFKSAGNWEEMMENARLNGFPERELREAINRHPGRMYIAKRTVNLTHLREGDTIGIGEYSFRCVETPGHSPGHLCLYEPDKRIFFSGDHVLESITPNISVWARDDDSLSEYLASLEKIIDFDVAMVLPGHRKPFAHLRRRIEELKKHHEQRNAEILSILKSGRLNGYQVASRMTWDIDCESWEDFPLPQQWFATGEALAHLRYLAGRGSIRQEQSNGMVTFSA